MYMYRYLLCACFLQRREGRFPETGVMDSCEPSCVMGLGTKHESSAQAKYSFLLSHLSSPIYITFLKKSLKGNPPCISY